MEYVTVANTADFTTENKRKITYEDREILLAKYEGSFYAVDNTCTHMGGSLYDGKLEGFTITCPKHGSVYDIRTGEVVERGKIFMIKVKVSPIRKYPVEVDGAEIKIGI
ncbi:Rieske (2Fe-2S) protein [Parasporobacterium paucivorans]|uniref:3-phenylpropionate/trans-cinnamate dioxygenase ferredoxin subunit n=1 Tax=Parasporobacterium paucivorans DSM 15970 TaxID=1122934 RepID=A0A1M6GHL2_9FIRM|nr:Rieske 2Fe-2S domain-containing protein [Parasporobacterium paucivorans]SHJ09439.1 3-phenylpropionate/trans-cinnamate dioxygenase ferredoxin subunit [Parasporobacterium paucivorans DSM 15970]